MLMQPSQADVRRYFCATYAKWRANQPMDAMETLIAGWMEQHPEYHADLADVDAALAAMQKPDLAGQANPFLHLSMHLSISEQCSIDQPRGIRQAVELLSKRLDGGLHDAHHAAMECLGQMLADSQRSGLPPDGATYVAAVQRRATRD